MFFILIFVLIDVNRELSRVKLSDCFDILIQYLMPKSCKLSMKRFKKSYGYKW